MISWPQVAWVVVKAIKCPVSGFVCRKAWVPYAVQEKTKEAFRESWGIPESRRDNGAGWIRPLR